MSHEAESEAVVVRGVLDGGIHLEWRANQSATIYVGSDPRCSWRVTAEGVAPFHWHLCWYGRRLWMSDLSAGQGSAPGVRGAYQWTMAPVGSVMRLGATVMVFEIARGDRAAVRGGAPAAVGRAFHSDPTIVMGLAPARGGGPLNAAGEIDLDATQLVDADELRALPPFGPPPGAGLPGQAIAPRANGSVMPRLPRPQPLEEMFIVPAQMAAPPPKRPSPWARLTAVVPARVLIALIAAGGMTAVTFLPEGLHAEHEEAAPARLPPRRPPPEPEIDVRALQPDRARATDEAEAARDLAAGRLDEALKRYRALQEAAPGEPVYRDFADVIERRIKARCARGECGENAR